MPYDVVYHCYRCVVVTHQHYTINYKGESAGILGGKRELK